MLDSTICAAVAEAARAGMPGANPGGPKRVPRDSKKGMIGALGIPRDSKKGIIGALGIPRDSKKVMIGALGIPRDSKKGIIGDLYSDPWGLQKGNDWGPRDP